MTRARLEGLRWRLRETRRLWRRGAMAEGLARAAARGPEPGPDGGPRGSLDQPLPGATLRRGPTTFHGWAHIPDEPVARVEIWIGDRPLGRARLGIGRPDVLEKTGSPDAIASGFELTVNLAEWPMADGETPVRAVATSLSGEAFELPPEAATVSWEADPGPAERAGPPPIATAQPTGPGMRTVVFTHQLGLGGAQLYLVELLRELLDLGAVNPTVISGVDGPVRAQLEELGVPVHIAGMVDTQDIAAHLGRIEELVAWAEGRDFELALINTATVHAYPGAEVAAALDIPAVWAIHESFEPAVIWAGLSDPVRARAEQALGEAATVIFEAEATKDLFEPLARPGSCVTLPYGLDLDPVESVRSGFDRAAARRAAGLPNDADVLLCVGTVEPRKAQVSLAIAFDAIAARHPRAHLVCVGAQDNQESRLLAEVAAGAEAAERISVVPLTPDIQPWFGVADVLVCASDIESLPRTVIEAMAWEMPVLATSIFGLPDLIDDGENGWLIEPRDVGALVAGLERALDAPAEDRRRIGERARATVLERHDLGAYGREVAEILATAARDRV